MESGLHWGIFLEQAPFGGETYLHWIWDGFLVTTKLFVCSWIVAFVVGSFFGILRTAPKGYLRIVGATYVAVFRNIPLIVQFFLWYLLAPSLLPEATEEWFKMEINPDTQFFILSVLCLGLFTGARVCEQVRSGIEALAKGQMSAGLALGLTLPQTYRYVILPNAYRLILPPMTSEMLNMVKNSAVAQTIGLIELAAQANRLLEFSARAYESFIAVTVAYILLNFIVMQLMRFVEKRVNVSTRAMGGKNA